jgi:hypothetical protein
MNDNYLAFLKSIMPDLYFNIMDKEDFESHSHLIEKIIKPENKEKLYHFKGDIDIP